MPLILCLHRQLFGVESVVPDKGPQAVSSSIAEIVANITREQLCDDRTAAHVDVPVAVSVAPVDVPAEPIAGANLSYKLKAKIWASECRISRVVNNSKAHQMTKYQNRPILSFPSCHRVK